ncbi:MAG: hypothetical protein AB7V48_16145 [Sedimentibacter sp.]
MVLFDSKTQLDSVQFQGKTIFYDSENAQLAEIRPIEDRIFHLNMNIANSESYRTKAAIGLFFFVCMLLGDIYLFVHCVIEIIQSINIPQNLFLMGISVIGALIIGLMVFVYQKSFREHQDTIKNSLAKLKIANNEKQLKLVELKETS